MFVAQTPPSLASEFEWRWHLDFIWCPFDDLRCSLWDRFAFLFHWFDDASRSSLVDHISTTYSRGIGGWSTFILRFMIL
jgi:hypothetical protein